MSTKKAKKKNESIDFFIADMDTGNVENFNNKEVKVSWSVLTDIQKTTDPKAISPQNETSISDGNGGRINLNEDKDKIVKK